MKANSTQRAVRLQSKRDSVHIVFADSKPDFDEEAFHTLSAADDDMVIEVIDTDGCKYVGLRCINGVYN